MSRLFAPPDPFEPPSLSYLFLSSPPKFLLRIIYGIITFLRSSPIAPFGSSIRVVCISDTHCNIPDFLPDGDLLIHAGDLTNAGTPRQLQEQVDWLNAQSHTHKIVISGNHDTYLDPRSRRTLPPSDIHGTVKWGKVQYLQHSSVTLTFPSRQNRRLKVHGAPQIPACGGPEFAFQYPRGSDAWTDTVPEDTDILVTHTPPKYHMDLPAGLGDEYLLREIWRVRPRLHVYGHVHAGAGKDVAHWDKSQMYFERACSSKDGFWRSIFDIELWMNVTRVAFYGLSSLLWDRVWGGEQKSSWLVNSALMYINTGRLGNSPQYVDL